MSGAEVKARVNQVVKTTKAMLDRAAQILKWK